MSRPRACCATTARQMRSTLPSPWLQAANLTAAVEQDVEELLAPPPATASAAQHARAAAAAVAAAVAAVSARQARPPADAAATQDLHALSKARAGR